MKMKLNYLILIQSYYCWREINMTLQELKNKKTELLNEARNLRDTDLKAAQEKLAEAKELQNKLLPLLLNFFLFGYKTYIHNLFYFLYNLLVLSLNLKLSVLF